MIIFSNQVWWSRVTIGHANYALKGVDNLFSKASSKIA